MPREVPESKETKNHYLSKNNLKQKENKISQEKMSSRIIDKTKSMGRRGKSGDCRDPFAHPWLRHKKPEETGKCNKGTTTFREKNHRPRHDFRFSSPSPLPPTLFVSLFFPGTFTTMKTLTRDGAAKQVGEVGVRRVGRRKGEEKKEVEWRSVGKGYLENPDLAAHVLAKFKSYHLPEQFHKKPD